MASTSTDAGPADKVARLRVVNLEKQDSRVVKPKRQPRVNLAAKSLTKEERAQLKYAQFEPMYQLWLQYALQMMPEVSTKGKPEGDRLLRMEWLGAMLMVTEADNPSMVGLVGIVVLETKLTMQLITKKDKYLSKVYSSDLVIPKAGSVFQTAFRGKVLTLFGDAMRLRPSQRGRKSRLRQKLPFSLR
ncbi:hypothetical protein PRIPAC_86415 [Pristionchus pacificus]|uniref:Ribonuclease P protein subunit p29 n=1 Tax=Pristionchus pacificus TaxID=54126 RepID=A0A2A6BMM8_PRIPA|nr:hypothetical protein PRIPAC_86415 [Pristionchus pacificus]|eukprot:PDM67155.1 hypothetical protein PRIPAC_48572 [Pristionchus pacificus]